MANVRLFGETSGFVQLAAPDAAGNNTITLPTTGTELVAADATGNITIDGTATFAVGASGTPAIAASGDANTGIYFPAADTIAFTEGGNEVARFDSSGRLGINSTEPTRPLTVATPSGQTVNILGVFDSSDANPATVSNCVIAFSDPTSTGGQFSTRLGSVGDSLAFYTNGANERLRILSGGGITFNGDTATANALDDYEEGTWTPTFSAPGATFTYSSQLGSYIKIGTLVYAAFFVQISAVSGGSGTCGMGGLPFATGNSASNPNPGGFIQLVNNWNTNHPDSLEANGSSTTVFNLNYRTAANGTNNQGVPTSNFQANTFVRATAVYFSS